MTLTVMTPAAVSRQEKFALPITALAAIAQALCMQQCFKGQF